MAAVAAVAAEAAAGPPLPARAIVDEFVQVFATGDQARFEQFARDRLDPTALAETSAPDQAATLARLYDDTGGIRVERIVAQRRGVIVAEGRDAMTGTRQCVTFAQSVTGGKPSIREFSARPLYPAGARLSAPSAEEVVAKLSSIAARFDARGLMSGVLLIAQGDRVLFERAYGYASVAHRDPMTLGTRLNIASIGKVITGVAIAQLVDAGRLSYDDKVGSYLPNTVDPAIRSRATIRQLLSHTSGLGPRDYYEFSEWDSARPLLRDVPAYLDLVKREKITVGSPQGQFLYSNAGYVVLGAIIEKVSGQSFYDYVEQHIFRPAGMTSAFYGEADGEVENVAEPLTNLFSIGPNAYRYRRGMPRKAIYELAARGGPMGGATLTAHDLLRFELALGSGKLISAARRAEIETPTSPSGAGAKGLSGDVREGLGVEVVRQNGHLLFGHTGGDLGVAASMYIYPDHDLTIIVLTNRDPRAGRVLTSYSRALLTRNVIAGAASPPQHCAIPGRA